MDSDKYAPTAGQLRVQGLPTLILFRGGEEIDRIEGALMKEQLVQWIESKL
jgi:thioredoxin-like negative regulator of GroEL